MTETSALPPAPAVVERSRKQLKTTQRAVLGAIHLYQAYANRRPSPCRYWPTCSAYAAEAVERHGAWRGGRMAIRRVLRCRPFGPHGVDPVPEEPRRRGARR